MIFKGKVKHQIVKRIILIEGLANIIILLIKLMAGIMSGSLAIMSDAIHSLADILNNIIAWFIVSISSKPADDKHPYGHGKFETLAVFWLASLLILLAFELVLHIFQKSDDQVISETWIVGLMIAVLGVNIIIAIWQRFWAKKLDSKILLADASHTFSDVLTTIVVILGWQFSILGYEWLDKATALGVVIVVIYLAYKLFKTSIPVLVDQIAIEPEELIKAVKTISGINKVSRARSRWIGSEKAVDIVITVNPNLSIKESHIIADKIESNLEKRFGVKDVSIHIEP